MTPLTSCLACSKERKEGGGRREEGGRKGERKEGGGRREIGRREKGERKEGDGEKGGREEFSPNFSVSTVLTMMEVHPVDAYYTYTVYI